MNVKSTHSVGNTLFARPAAGLGLGGLGGLRALALGFGPADRTRPSLRAAGLATGDPGDPGPDHRSTPCGLMRRQGRWNDRSCSTCWIRSQSMAIGKEMTRWDQVVQMIREAGRVRDPRAGAQVSLFRFGSHLAAVDADFGRPAEAKPASRSAPGAVLAAEPPRPTEPPPAPTDSDTLLGASLEGLTDRFGQAPPQAVVVFSDGRARDPDRADAIARAYGQMKVPIHVLPVGDENVGGDVAIVSMVAPNQVRKFSRVAAQVYVRSYGYKGKRSELKIVAVASDGKPETVLARTPVVLKDGVVSYSLVFESGDQDRRIEARIEPATGRGVGVEQRLRCRPGHRPYQDPRALPGRGDRAIRRAASYLRDLRRQRGPRGLLTPPASADGGPGRRVHGGDARRGGRRFLDVGSHQ